MWANIAWRLFARELRRGELWLICFAMILSVFTVVSLSGITNAVSSAFAQRGSTFLAADLVLRSSRDINQRVEQEAQALGLQTAQQLQFNSMAFAGDAMQLVSVKAVSSHYPLRGILSLRASQDPHAGAELALATGQVFLEPRLFSLLQVTVGDMIDLGEARLKVAGVIAAEPEQQFSLFNSAPRLLMHMDDVAATAVVKPGSRLSYRLMVAGPESVREQLIKRSQPHLRVQERWQRMDGESPLGQALLRAERFLLLAGLLGIILACAAAAVAAVRYSQRHQQAVAVMKALGASTAMVRRIFLSHLACIMLFSSISGITLGQFAIWQAGEFLTGYVDNYQAEFTALPLLLGVMTALICALLFAARPILRLVQIPALQVLRLSMPAIRVDMLQAIAAVMGVFCLLWLFSRDLWLSLVLLGVCAGLVVVLLLLALVLMRLLKPVAAGQPSAWRLALANLRRRLWANSMALITFTVALYLSLLLMFLRTGLLAEWQQQVPQGAPNQFVVNIQSSDIAPIQQQLTAQSLSAGTFFPMMQGRLMAVNGQAVQENNSAVESSQATSGDTAAGHNSEGNTADNSKAEAITSPAHPPKDSGNSSANSSATDATATPRRPGIGRELNLTWVTQLPAFNTVVEGQWFAADSRNEISMEADMAERLKLKLGDELRFAIGGQVFDFKLTSIRKVDWNSLQPNFFAIVSPAQMSMLSPSYLMAFYLPETKQAWLPTFSKAWPTLTVISVQDIIKQIQTVIADVSQALLFILLLVVVSAALVLLAQVQATLEERKQELLILRTLGASRGFIRQAVMLEFAVLGFMAGMLATVLAEVTLMLVQVRLFELPFTWHAELWWIGPSSGVILVFTIGMLLLRPLLFGQRAALWRQAQFAS